MSDEHLRGLERRWKETGAVEDEAAYLLERVRVGSFTMRRAGLAAYFGHPACKKMCGQINTAETIRPLEDCAAVISRHDKETIIRAMIAAIRITLPVWLELPDNPWPKVPEQIIAIAEDWLICKCDACSAELGRFTAVVEGPVEMATQRSADEDIAARAQNVVLNVRELIESALGSTDAQDLEWLLVHAGEALNPEARTTIRELILIYQAIREEVVPWLLGREDPIFARVESRGVKLHQASD